MADRACPPPSSWAPLRQAGGEGEGSLGGEANYTGVELVGDQAEQACHPQENEGRELMINMNSTRRVRWTVKLGMARPIAVSLSILVEGE